VPRVHAEPWGQVDGVLSVRRALHQRCSFRVPVRLKIIRTAARPECKGTWGVQGAASRMTGLARYSTQAQGQLPS
jgi:hypothetical protein